MKTTQKLEKSCKTSGLLVSIFRIEQEGAPMIKKRDIREPYGSRRAPGLGSADRVRLTVVKPLMIPMCQSEPATRPAIS
ncbi:MAG: hypothetical protein C5B58_13935 [Acidobacteria bacterium]|nr:MAG: hypothetical protein C5B58_13935 [Acidobacteriota bacterium]